MLEQVKVGGGVGAVFVDGGGAEAAVAAELGRVPLFAGLTAEKLAWLTARGDVVRVGRGAILAREGDPVEHLYVILEGELRISKRVDGRETVINTYGPGTFFGEVPLLANKPFLASGRALRETRVFRLQAGAFRQIMAANPSVAETVLATMAARVGHLQSIAAERQRLSAVGTLAAGLAHELNNPVAAARRAAARLREDAPTLPALALRLCRMGLTAEQIDAVERSERQATAIAAAARTLDPLSAADREDELGTWLEARAVDAAWDLAASLAGAGLGRGWLEELERAVPPAALEDALRCVAATLDVAGLAREVERGTARVSAMVESLRAYSWVDRSPEAEVDLREGIESTLAVLASRLDGVALERDHDPKLPRVAGLGAELNEVWTALLDNALDALGGRGTIRVRTACEADHVLVEIADDGPGIPPEVMTRVFEPFFTTKDVGQGNGLGLHLARRIVVDRHGGDIRVESRPGETRVQVRLPVGVGVGSRELE